MSDTPERWVEETTYIVKEMFHAIEQSKICEPDRVKGWMNRAEYLRDRAKFCITNAFNDVVTGDADDTSHQTVVKCDRCGGIRKPDFFMPCVCKNPTHPELVETEEE